MIKFTCSRCGIQYEALPPLPPQIIDSAAVMTLGAKFTSKWKFVSEMDRSKMTPEQVEYALLSADRATNEFLKTVAGGFLRFPSDHLTTSFIRDKGFVVHCVEECSNERS